MLRERTVNSPSDINYFIGKPVSIFRDGKTLVKNGRIIEYDANSEPIDSFTHGSKTFIAYTRIGDNGVLTTFRGDRLVEL